MKTWYAVYTKKNCEKKVLYQLKRRRIKYFFPLNMIFSHNVAKYEPLFPSYIFIYISEDELKEILTIKDIINPVYWLNKPVCCSEREIDKLNAFLKNHLTIEVKKMNRHMNALENEIVERAILEVINQDSLPIDTLSIPILGVLLRSERILAPEFRLERNHSFNKFLYRLGLNNVL